MAGCARTVPQQCRQTMAAIQSDSQLPAPTCRSGYPLAQVETILGARAAAFWRWHEGQTGAICDGRSFDHDTRQYRDTGCGPHGPVVYRWDLERFLDRQRYRRAS